MNDRLCELDRLFKSTDYGMTLASLRPQGAVAEHSCGHSHCPRPRRSRHRRRGHGRVFGTNRPANSPGRRLARVFVPLGELNGPFEGRVFLAKTGGARYQVRAFSGSCRRIAWSAAIAQLVEHVIRNDGVTGSSPVCGTSFFSGNPQRHRSVALLWRRR